MFKNKWFLRGMGIGLISGALLLQAMNAFAGAELSTAGNTSGKEIQWDVQTLKTSAAEKDMVVLTNKEWESLKAASAPKTQASAAPAASAAPGPTPATNEKRWLYIYEGMSSDDVELYLSLAGVLSDRLAFRETVKADKLARKIRAGLYAFSPGEKVEDIIAKIVAKAN